MSKLSAAFGDSNSLRIKSFVLGEHTFKVRVPISKELEHMQERISTVDTVKADARFQKMKDGLGKEVEGVVVSEDDVVVDGRSMRELVKTISQLENRVVEYIKLLVPPTEQSLADITYEEIEEEWPMQVQLEMIDKISEAIQPGYKEARKN